MAETDSTCDVLIIGAGIIGLTLALELAEQGAHPLIVERGEPAQEASWAAAGMLTRPEPDCDPSIAPWLTRSIAEYPEYVERVARESGEPIDFRRQGTLLKVAPQRAESLAKFYSAQVLSPQELQRREPALADAEGTFLHFAEDAVDPRQLTLALCKLLAKRGVDIRTGIEITGVNLQNDKLRATSAGGINFSVEKIVDCAGAWSALPPCQFLPIRPVKGHMLCYRMDEKLRLKHVLRDDHIYIVPRSDGRILLGSTLEDRGFDKQIDRKIIAQVAEQGTQLLPALRDAKIVDTWTGLRPASSDGLPIMGSLTASGIAHSRLFISTGHYRNGILLAPLSARYMAARILGRAPYPPFTPDDGERFSPQRFLSQSHAHPAAAQNV